ncbi:MAG: bacillithiol biosynthesis BshC, partial [Lentisphaerae bacterium]
LYTLFKCHTAVRIAHFLRRKSDLPVQPLFWLATEDHDLSEIVHAYFPDRSFHLELAGVTGPVAVEKLPMEVARPAREELLALASVERHDEIATLTAMAGLRDYSAYTAALLARLMGPQAPVLFEPRLLRKDLSGFYRKVLHLRQEIRQALVAGAERMQRHGLPVAFNVDRSFGMFYLTAEGYRYRIEENAPGCFAVTARQWREDELEREIDEFPERFSLSAYLRPVAQCLLFPTVAYVGGPGEIRYHLQLKELFSLFDAGFPCMIPRCHGTIIGPPERRILQRHNLSLDVIRHRAQDYYCRPELPENMARPFARLVGELDQAFAQLLANMDAGNPDILKSGHKRILKELEKIRQRLTREYARSREIDNAKIDKLFHVLRPGGQPQERRLNIFYFVLKYGAGFLPKLFDQLPPLAPAHFICELE